MEDARQARGRQGRYRVLLALVALSACRTRPYEEGYAPLPRGPCGRRFEVSLQGDSQVVSPIGLAAADLDGDGHLDLLPSGDRGIALLRGDGAGHFGPPRRVLDARLTWYPAIVDLDGDKLPDLVVAEDDVVGTVVALGDGAGGLRRKSVQPRIATAASTWRCRWSRRSTTRSPRRTRSPCC